MTADIRRISFMVVGKGPCVYEISMFGMHTSDSRFLFIWCHIPIISKMGVLEDVLLWEMAIWVSGL